VAESVLTAIAYYHLGLYAVESQNILWAIVPSVLVGIPLGAYVIRKLDAETFRRVCMSFDVWVVGFGLSRVLIDLKVMQSPLAYGAMAAAVLLDLYLLLNYFKCTSTTRSIRAS